MSQGLTIMVLTMAMIGCGPPSAVTKYFYSLDEAISKAYRDGRTEQVKSLCTEYLELAKIHRNHWNYGNAIHTGNVYLGLVALDEGRMADAKEHLLKAGDTPGSPQLDTFGPNLLLAKALLEKGEEQVVLEYLEKLSRFWRMDDGILEVWQNEIESGETPDFSLQLDY